MQSKCKQLSNTFSGGQVFLVIGGDWWFRPKLNGDLDKKVGDLVIPRRCGDGDLGKVPKTGWGGMPFFAIVMVMVI